MEEPREIWDDIEEMVEKINIKRRMITGGDIEDDITLKGKTFVYMLDEAYDQFDEMLGGIYDNIMDGVYDLGLGARENLDELADEIKGLREHLDEKRKEEAESEEEENFDLLDELHDRWEGILKRFKD
jgi:hypothetical protein